MKIQEAIEYLQQEQQKEGAENVQVKLQFLRHYTHPGRSEVGHPIGIDLKIQSFIGGFRTSQLDACFPSDAYDVYLEDFAAICDMLFWDAGFSRWVTADSFFMDLRTLVASGGLSIEFGQYLDECKIPSLKQFTEKYPPHTLGEHLTTYVPVSHNPNQPGPEPLMDSITV